MQPFRKNGDRETHRTGLRRSGQTKFPGRMQRFEVVPPLIFPKLFVGKGGTRACYVNKGSVGQPGPA